MNKTINKLRAFFTITVAAFEFKRVIDESYGINDNKTDMHNLHLLMKEELDKANPDLNIIDSLLKKMANEARSNNK